MASMMRQRVVGVVENMSYLTCPHCGDSHRIEVFGSGGGQAVADTLSARFGYAVPLISQVPLDLSVRVAGDLGTPIVVSDPASPAARALTDCAARLTAAGRGLAGRQLGLSPAGR
jgi:ATP-binding protein involved in chromosome partitioning